MATIPTIVDVRDAAGNSLVRANVDGTKPLLVVQLATGLIGTFTKSGDTGIVSIAIDPAAAQALGALTAASLEVTGAGTALLVDNDAEIDGNIIAGGDMHVGASFRILASGVPILAWGASGPTVTLGGHPSGWSTVIDGRTIHMQQGGADKITIDPTGIGEYGHATTGQGPSITQTYATTATTIPAYTANVQSSAYTGIDNLQAAGTPYATVADLNTLRAAYENLRAQSEATTQVLNRVIDYWQARGSLT